jgi:hypothetical protein
VIVEQNQATTKNIIDMPAFSKYKRNPEVKAFIEEFQNADANGRLTLINSKITGLKNKFPKTVEKINSLLGLAKSGKDVSCQCKDIKANIEQKMTAEKSFDPMFLILIVIILLVVFVGSGGPRSCAEQMGLS